MPENGTIPAPPQTPAVRIEVPVGVDSNGRPINGIATLPTPVTETMLFNFFANLGRWYQQQFAAEHPANGIVVASANALGQLSKSNGH